MALDLEKILDESGAILKGHFILSSGRHSAIYFEKFRVVEQPQVLSALCQSIAEHFRETKIDFVAGPLTAGIIMAFEVARQLGVPARYIESENGVKTFRRGASLPAGSKVLVVDDVLTTGLSVRESADAVRAAGGEVIAYAVMIDRSVDVEFDAPLYAAYRVDSTSYSDAELPGWLAEIPPVKPGTRKAT